MRGLVLPPGRATLRCDHTLRPPRRPTTTRARSRRRRWGAHGGGEIARVHIGKRARHRVGDAASRRRRVRPRAPHLWRPPVPLWRQTSPPREREGSLSSYPDARHMHAHLPPVHRPPGPHTRSARLRSPRHRPRPRLAASKGRLQVAAALVEAGAETSLRDAANTWYFGRAPEPYRVVADCVGFRCGNCSTKVTKAILHPSHGSAKAIGAGCACRGRAMLPACGPAHSR